MKCLYFKVNEWCLNYFASLIFCRYVGCIEESTLRKWKRGLSYYCNSRDKNSYSVESQKYCQSTGDCDRQERCHGFQESEFIIQKLKYDSFSQSCFV